MRIHRCGISFEANLGKGFQYLAPGSFSSSLFYNMPTKSSNESKWNKNHLKKRSIFFFFVIMSRKIEIGILIVNVNFP